MTFSDLVPSEEHMICSLSLHLAGGWSLVVLRQQASTTQFSRPGRAASINHRRDTGGAPLR